MAFIVHNLLHWPIIISGIINFTYFYSYKDHPTRRLTCRQNEENKQKDSCKFKLQYIQINPDDKIVWQYQHHYFLLKHLIILSVRTPLYHSIITRKETSNSEPGHPSKASNRQTESRIVPHESVRMSLCLFILYSKLFQFASMFY